MQKRLAAYLVLMRNPKDSDIEMVKKLLKQEQNVQIKSFVNSHVYNIISSTDAETQKYELSTFQVTTQFILCVMEILC